MKYYLAVDIGASSGRHILGWSEDGIIKTEEIYRFENSIKEENNNLVWDIENLFKNVITGIKKCGELGKIPKTIAIDTWGVDYVLLDENLKEILPVYSYRDSRTDNMPETIDKIIPADDLYKRTGIQRQNFNTIYQLYHDKITGKLEKAEHFLMIPEYLSYKLTGVMKSEYTIASTTSLLNASNRDWDMDLIKELGIKETIFNPVSQPGDIVGNFTDEIEKYVGFNSSVVFAPSHDTASAVAACNLYGHGMFISSGTWSLIGAKNNYPVLTEEARKANFTNEGGVENTYRFLKNIMGMWLFQNIKKNLNSKFSYDEMMEMAKKSDFIKTFDPNDQRLVAPQNMIEAIRECLDNSDLPIEDVISSVYHSLANSYKKAVEEIEFITGEKIDSINIVGGGSKDKYLNELTEIYTKKPVVAGPSEATAMGNLKIQMKLL